MPQRPLSVIGLALALFVGLGVGTRGLPTIASAPGAAIATNSALGPAVPKPKAANDPAAVPGLTQDGCYELTATTSAGKWHINNSTRTLEKCLPPLPAIVRTLCRLNPAFSVSDQLRYQSELEELQPDSPIIRSCLGNGPSIATMMASVADPNHSHLGLLTDRTLEVIQAGAAVAGYNPYSHYFPWEAPPSAQHAGETPPVGAIADDHQPGLLVFRSDSKAPRYLAVFLIAELPTTGLDEQAFFTAKGYIDTIWKAGSKANKNLLPGTTYLLGPNFSGSDGSIKDIDSQLKPRECIRASSGPITAASYANIKQRGTLESCTSVLFPIQTPDSAALAEFVHAVRGLYGYRAEDIAVLSEGGTEFGNSMASQVNPKDLTPGPLYLQFPREIAKLRNAYGTSASHPAPAAAPNQPTPDVELRWQDSQATRGDDVPVYGGEQTPFSQEAVLSRLAIDIKSRRIKALGILATDPMDEAFLLRSFRRALPDVRLFLRDPDLLYLSTPDAGSLNGVLLVNDFPLLSGDERWDSSLVPAHPQLNSLTTLASSTQEAQYNSFLFMLNALDVLDSATLRDRLLEWNWPAGNGGALVPGDPHPLWLTAIGTSGHFPVAMLNETSSPGGAGTGGLALHGLDVGGPTYASLLLWMCAAGLGILHVLALSRPDLLPSSLGNDFDLGDASDTIVAAKASCHLAMLLILVLIELILGSSYLYFSPSQTIFRWLAVGVGFVATVLFVTSCAIFAARIAWPWWQWRNAATMQHQDIVPIRRPLLMSLFSVTIFAGIGIFWLRSAFGRGFNPAFLNFRDLNIGSGVSPSLPLTLLLLVAYFGTWAYARRLTCWGQWRPVIPRKPLDEVLPSNFDSRTLGIDKCIVSSLEHGGWFAAFIALFCVGLGNFLLRNNLDMLDEPGVRLATQVSFGLALFVLMLNWFRFINIWYLLRSILSSLERLPLRHAFPRMPKEKAMPIWRWGTSDYSTVASTQNIERLRALLHQKPNLIDSLSYSNVKSKISILGRFEERKTGIWGLLYLLLRAPQIEVVALRHAVGGAPVSIAGAGGPGQWQGKSIPNQLGFMVAGARESMIQILNQLIDYLSADYWRRGSDGSEAVRKAKGDARLFRLAEDMIALRYYMFIRYVVAEMRSLLFFIALAFSLMFLAFHVYAFRTDEAIDWSFLFLFVFLGAGIVVVLYQIELDDILSHLGGGKPGEVGVSFYGDLLKYGALPLLTVIGSQVPAVSNLLLRWVQPALQSMH